MKIIITEDNFFALKALEEKLKLDGRWTAMARRM